MNQNDQEAFSPDITTPQHRHILKTIFIMFAQDAGN